MLRWWGNRKIERHFFELWIPAVAYKIRNIAGQSWSMHGHVCKLVRLEGETMAFRFLRHCFVEIQ
jgi:hypothetical protein